MLPPYFFYFQKEKNLLKAKGENRRAKVFEVRSMKYIYLKI
jgi:hypothetical protein